MYNVLICGDRYWNDKELLSQHLNRFVNTSTLFISGGCSGADLLAEKYANEYNIPIKVYYANWSKYGRAAGPIRNDEMLKENPNLVIAFHSHLEQSKGTADTIKKALAKNIPVWLVVSKDKALWVK